MSTKENAHKWYKQGYDIVDTIVNTRKNLMQELKQVVKNEIDLLENESKITRVIFKLIRLISNKYSFLFNRIKYFKLMSIIMNKYKLYSNVIFNHYSKHENNFYKNQSLI
jgi:hypothetical protein